MAERGGQLIRLGQVATITTFPKTGPQDQATTDTLDRLFSTDNRLLRAARDLGIAAVHRTPPLKRLFMRAAMGTRVGR